MSELQVPRSDVLYIKQCSIRFYLQFFVGGFMSYLRQLCLFEHGGVQHILCCVFVMFFLCLVHHMLPVFLDYPVCMALSVFSNVYIKQDDVHC